MRSTLSDNPASTGVIPAFVIALLALLQQFSVINITEDQVGAVLTFLAALTGLVTYLIHTLTVPKTPSTLEAPKTLQVPPPGAALVTEAAAAAPAPVPAGSVIATHNSPAT